MSAREKSAEWALRTAERAAAARDRFAKRARACKWWQWNKRERLQARAEASQREALRMLSLSAELGGDEPGRLELSQGAEI